MNKRLQGLLIIRTFLILRLVALMVLSITSVYLIYKGGKVLYTQYVTPCEGFCSALDTSYSGGLIYLNSGMIMLFFVYIAIRRGQNEITRYWR